MCTIAILIGVADSPVVLAANRDELYARPTRAPERLAPGLVGGVDELSGGTWLAVRANGRFAAVTNQRQLSSPPANVRSRGLVVKELALADDPDAYVAALDPRAYASMNLVWGDATRVSVGYLRNESGERTVEALGPGIHVLCNDRLGSNDFPRGLRLAATIAADHSVPALERALADHTKVDPPPSHLAPDLARELTATCIHSPHYGTRSSSIVAFDRGRVTQYLHADGPPCTAPFVSKRELLS